MDGQFKECCPWPKYCQMDGVCYREEMRKDRADYVEHLANLRRKRAAKRSRTRRSRRPSELPPAA